MTTSGDPWAQGSASLPRMSALRVVSRPAFRNRPLNPYNALINAELHRFGVEVREYRALRPWPFADLVHVHWPETTFNHDWLSALATTESLLATLRLRRRAGSRVVWTAHNLSSRRRRYPEWEQRFWSRLWRVVDGFIVLTEPDLGRVRDAHPALRDRPGWVLPHPHYRGAYPDSISREAARAQLDLPVDALVLTFFGQVVEYKNIPALIDLFRALAPTRPELHLVVAGRPRSEALAEQIRAASHNHPRIRLELRYIPEPDVQVFMRAASLVVLPYRELSNSGAALLALSFDRPLWAPALGSAPSLQTAVGSKWVRLYDRLELSALDSALTNLSDTPDRTDAQHLQAIAPVEIARQTSEIYRSLIGAR